MLVSMGICWLEKVGISRIAGVRYEDGSKAIFAEMFGNNHPLTSYFRVLLGWDVDSYPYPYD